jgi:Flp pilus assembly protein TadD
LILGPQAAQASPDFRTLVERGLEAIAAGQLDAAEAAFQEARRLQPENAAVYFQLGEIFSRRREYRKAIAHFRQAITLNPRQTEFYYGLALLQAQLQRFAEAQQVLKELRHIQEDDATSYLLAARIAQEQRDYAHAEDLLRRYVQLRPADPEGLWQLGATLIAQHKPEEAESLLKQALDKNPNSAGAHFNLGVLFSRQRDYAQARAHLEVATRLQPQNAEAYYLLGTALARLDDLANAEGAFRQALALDPKKEDAYYALGSLLQRTGRAEEASQVLAQARRVGVATQEEHQRSRRLSLLHHSVKELLEQDRLEEAEKKLGEIVQEDPRNDLAYYRQAQILYLRRDYAEALAKVQTALGIKDFDPAYPMLEGMCLERLGRDAEATQAYERVVALADYADAHLTLGRIEFRQGNKAQGLSHLRRAVDLEPENAEFRLILAEALDQTGEHAEAQKQRAEAAALANKATPQ